MNVRRLVTLALIGTVVGAAALFVQRKRKAPTDFGTPGKVPDVKLAVGNDTPDTAARKTGDKAAVGS